MASSSSEVGANKINAESYKCSINKITVSTQWQAPLTEISEEVTATVYDKQRGKLGGKDIYLISSPTDGKKITIKTEREDGKCLRENHKKYIMSVGDKSKSTPANSPSITPLSINRPIGKGGFNNISRTPPYLAKMNNQEVPVNTNNQNEVCQYTETEIKQEECLTIKSFEISSPTEAIKYCFLPIPVPDVKNTTAKFSYVTCEEGSFNYDIIPYPDISFKLEISIGTAETEEKQGGFSHFERNPTKIKNVPEKTTTLIGGANTDLKISPSLNALTKYNGNQDEVEIKLNFDTDKEVFHYKYKHDSTEKELGSEGIQNIKKRFEKFANFTKLLKNICSSKFIRDFVGYDSKSLVNTYSPYKLKLSPPNISISFEGQYTTSKNLLKIGRCWDLCFALEPLIKISFTIDLLFLILTAVSAGTATGFYVMLKNLDRVIKKILGRKYKKTYKDTKPFEADVYFNFVISGTVNGYAHWINNTAEQSNADSATSFIEGIVSVDLEAGAKVSLDVFFIEVEGEASASGSTGIQIKIGLNNHMPQGGAFAVFVEVIWLAIKIKYCIKGKIGLMKTIGAGGSLVDDEKTLGEKTILLQGNWELLKN